MILVSNSAHNNGIFTYINEAGGVVIKSSYTPVGIDGLERELAGYQWYFRIAGLEGADRVANQVFVYVEALFLIVGSGRRKSCRKPHRVQR